MATTENKAPKATETPKDDRVEIFVPRTPGNTDPNHIMALNGKNYVLPKGQSSIVPKAVAALYEEQKKAQYKLDNVIYGMVEKARQQAKEAGIK